MKQTLAQIDDRHGIQWRFDTPRYTVAFWAEEEDLDPEDSFQFPEDIEFARQDDPAHWFCAFVGVFKRYFDSEGSSDFSLDSDSDCIGYDCLGGCSYNSFSEFAGNRRGFKGTKLITGGYFPDMVRQALSEARAHELRLQHVAA